MRGFEMEESVQDKIKEGIFDTIRKGNAKADLGERIHCIWYCVNALDNRFEDAESEWLWELNAMPEPETFHRIRDRSLRADDPRSQP